MAFAIPTIPENEKTASGKERPSRISLQTGASNSPAIVGESSLKINSRGFRLLAKRNHKETPKCIIPHKMNLNHAIV